MQQYLMKSINVELILFYNTTPKITKFCTLYFFHPNFKNLLDDYVIAIFTICNLLSMDVYVKTWFSDWLPTISKLTEVIADSLFFNISCYEITSYFLAIL